jgi:hypothetical protein
MGSLKTCKGLHRLAIDLPAMADLEHDDLAALVAHKVDHPIIALPDPVLVLA